MILMLWILCYVSQTNLLESLMTTIHQQPTVALRTVVLCAIGRTTAPALPRIIGVLHKSQVSAALEDRDAP